MDTFEGGVRGDAPALFRFCHRATSRRARGRIRDGHARAIAQLPHVPSGNEHPSAHANARNLSPADRLIKRRPAARPNGLPQEFVDRINRSLGLGIISCHLVVTYSLSAAPAPERASPSIVG